MNRTYTHSEPETVTKRKNNIQSGTDWLPVILISLIGLIGLISTMILST